MDKTKAKEVNAPIVVQTTEDPQQITTQTSQQQLMSQQVMQTQVQNQTQQTGSVSNATQIRLQQTLANVGSFMPPAYEADIVTQLLNHKRTLHDDSPEMVLVKDKVRTAKEAMESSEEKVYTAKEIGSMIVKFDEAVKACSDYIHNPRKRKNNARWNMVNEVMQRFHEDSMRLEKARDLIQDGTWADKSATMRQMIADVAQLPANKQISNAHRREAYMKELAEVQKDIPKMTPVGFKMYKAFLKANRAGFKNDLYLKQYEKGKDIAMMAGAHGTYTRDVPIVLRHVNFDEAGDPVSPQDMENHQWNLQWIKAWEEDDFETRENMLSEQVPHALDNAPMPELSEAELSNPGVLTEKLGMWADGLSDDEIISLYETMHFSVSFDQTKKAHPSLRQFLDSNPAFMAKSHVFECILNFLSYYTQLKYGFTADQKVELKKPDPEFQDKYDAANRQSLLIMAMNVTNAYRNYLKEKDKPAAPYVKEEYSQKRKQEKIARVNAREAEKRIKDKKYDTGLRDAAFASRLAAEKQKVEAEGKVFDEKKFRDEISDKASDFDMAYAELAVYFKKQKIAINEKTNHTTVYGRKMRQVPGSLEALTDKEVFARIMSIDLEDPQYYRKLCDKISEICGKYDVSYDAMVYLENYRSMLDKKAEHEKKLAIDKIRQERLAEREKDPVTYDIPALPHVVQDKPQSFGQSCWARSGATMVNAMFTKLSKEDKSLNFAPIHDTFFLGTGALDYNEKARLKSNELGGGFIEPGAVDDYLAKKADIEKFRSKPGSASGNLFMMADYCLKATDNRAMVKAMQINIMTEESQKSIELLKDEFLNRLAVILNKNGGNPVSVLNGGHYVTVTGIKGRNLIYKESNNRSNPNKDFDSLSVDSLFSACKLTGSGAMAKGGAVEIVWLEPINDETMKDVKKEFPDVEKDYERLRKEGQDDALPDQYSHTKGVDFVRNYTNDDPVIGEFISTRVYLPKGMPGEKVHFENEGQEIQVQEMEQQVQQVQQATEEVITRNTLDVEPLADSIQRDAVKGDNRAVIAQLQKERKEVAKKVQAEKARLKRVEHAELTALRKLKDKEEYTDRDGVTYPYRNKKESRDDYILRVSRQINDKYENKRYDEGTKTRDIDQKIAYYSNANAVNTVDMEQIKNTLSEQRRDMMKKSLLVFVENDSQRNVSPKYKGKYMTFLKVVTNYANMKAEFYQHRGSGEWKYSTDEALLAENEAFNEMKKALDSLEKAVEKFKKTETDGQGGERIAADDANVFEMIKNYRGLFSSMSDGNLQVEKDAKVYKAKGNYYDRDGKKVKTRSMKNAPLFAHEPAVSDVIQGHLGDCYFVSTLASLVATDPGYIKDSMKDNGDGTVTVRFYRPNIDLNAQGVSYIKKPIYINVPKKTLDGEGAKGTLWVNCMELAYHQYLRQANVRQNAVVDFMKELKGAQKEQYRAKLFEIKENKKIDNEFRDESRINTEQISKWMLPNAMEDYIESDPVLAKKYEEFLEKRLKKEETKDVDAHLIEGGFAANVLSAFTGKVHSINRIDFSNHQTSMNNLSYPFKNLLETVWKDNPITAIKSVSRKKAEEDAKDTVVEIRVLQTRINDLKSKIQKADAHVKKGGKLSANVQKEYDGYVAELKEKEDLFKQKNDVLKTFGYDSEQDYSNRKGEWENEANIEEMASEIVAHFLSGFEIRENIAQNDSKLRAFMTMEQMKSQISLINADNLAANPKYAEAVNTILTTGTTKDQLRNMSNIPNVEQRIKDCAEQMLKSFVKDAAKNTVLNYEHFTGYYSKQAEDTFDEIQKGIEQRKAIVAGTFNFRPDLAETEETGEPVFDGIASTHEYSVLGVKTMTVPNPKYQPGVDERKEITHKFIRVRNPWASTHVVYEKQQDGSVKTIQNRDDATGGVDELELNDFMNRFFHVDFAGTEDFK